MNGSTMPMIMMQQHSLSQSGAPTGSGLNMVPIHHIAQQQAQQQYLPTVQNMGEHVNFNNNHDRPALQD
jgi:hypothetical protein